MRPLWRLDTVPKEATIGLIANLADKNAAKRCASFGARDYELRKLIARAPCSSPK